MNADAISPRDDGEGAIEHHGRARDEPRISIVVLTHNRADELDGTLSRLSRLPERAPIVVVDNASVDDTAERVRRHHPQITLLRCERNLGAAGRNLGVAAVRTPYVAFCDDDTWWAPGALTTATRLLDAHPRVAALAAHVRVGEDGRDDPTCALMAASPLPRDGLPGAPLIGFMAGAVVMRTAAFRAVGGYEPRLFLGGEERLIGLDLLAHGWAIVHAPEVVTHHHPSRLRDAAGRRRLLRRNAVWIAMLRLPWPSLRAELRSVWREAAGERWTLLRDVLPGVLWAWRRRQVLPPHVERWRRLVLDPPPH